MEASDVVAAIEAGHQVSDQELMKYIAEELECATLGGVMKAQTVNVDGTEATIALVNGQMFKLWIVPA